MKVWKNNLYVILNFLYVFFYLLKVIWFQISKKPVPILDINLNDKEGKGKKDNSDFSKDNMLEDYYKSLKLEYKRRNDITIFKHSEYELKSILDSAEMPIRYLNRHTNDFETELNKQQFLWKHIENAIDKKVSYWEMDDFYKQFTELENFTNSILKYTISLQATIKKMNEIPID